MAADIAKVLLYRNAPDMTRNLDDDETDKHILRIRSENGVEQDREVTIINESGQYPGLLDSTLLTFQERTFWYNSRIPWSG